MKKVLSFPIDSKASMYKVLDEVAELFGVSSEDFIDKRPAEVVLNLNIVNNGYNFLTNQIVVSNPELLKRKGFLAEEFTHFLRSIYESESLEDVQEFFGGLARLVIGKEHFIAMPGAEVTAEGMTKIEKEMATASEYSTEISRVVQGNNKAPINLLNDFEAEAKAKLGVLRLVQGWYSTEFDGKNLEPAYGIINASPIPERQKKELREKLQEPDGLSKAIMEVEDDLEKTLVMADHLNAKEDVWSIMDAVNNHAKAAADVSLYKTQAHVKGYEWAQNIRDSGRYRNILKDHPDLIKLPDKKVRKIIKKYLKKSVMEKKQ